jgi:hypothetical protein
MALLTWAQNLGSALFLTASNAIFAGALRSEIPVLAPGVNAEMVIAAGGTSFREAVPEASLPGVLLAFSRGIDRVFYMNATLAGLTFVACFGMGWVDVRKKGPDEEKV